MKKILFCYGTRPELIKISSVVSELRKYPFVKIILLCSGQHRELLRGLTKIFRIADNFNLNIRSKIQKSAELSLLFSELLKVYAEYFTKLEPNVIIVQGDTLSSYCAALAAFHQQIPINYIESGLRTFDLKQPFPEEGYRQMITRISKIHFAPTQLNRTNLINEGIDKKQIHVVGNTAIDTLRETQLNLEDTKVENLMEKELHFLKAIKNQKLVIVEVHRRENYGKPLIEVLSALLEIRSKNPNYIFIFSVHPSPNIRNIVHKSLGDREGFILIQPPPYNVFIALLQQASLIITDSGGLQEEAPTIGLPVIVVREKTERTESIAGGWSYLTGTDKDKIIKTFTKLKNWKRPNKKNPYGDGYAAKRIAKIIYENIQ